MLRRLFLNDKRCFTWENAGSVSPEAFRPLGRPGRARPIKPKFHARSRGYRNYLFSIFFFPYTAPPPSLIPNESNGFYNNARFVFPSAPITFLPETVLRFSSVFSESVSDPVGSRTRRSYLDSRCGFLNDRAKNVR